MFRLHCLLGFGDRCGLGLHLMFSQILLEYYQSQYQVLIAYNSSYQNHKNFRSPIGIFHRQLLKNESGTDNKIIHFLNDNYQIQAISLMSNNQLNSYPLQPTHYNESAKDLKSRQNMTENPTAMNNNYFQGQPVVYPQPVAYNSIGNPNMQNYGYTSVYPPGTIQYQGQVLRNQLVPGATIVVNKNTGMLCQFCHKTSSQFRRKKTGCATLSWSACLCVFTGLCCWIPWVIDDCYDQYIVCSGCQQVKMYSRSRFGL